MPTVNTSQRQHHYVQIGDCSHPDAVKTRIVHISDTHLQHLDMLDIIPEGDILVHSGDFHTHHRNQPTHSEEDFLRLTTQLNNFFNLLPHKHKIFVPGNHEVNLDDKTPETVQNLLPSCSYLQDASITIEGLNFYGAGWTLARECSSARGFAVEPKEIGQHWDKIPADTDILVTHSPPHAILDCSHCYPQGCVESCEPYKDCGHGHVGCPQLRDVVLNTVRPKAHLFGHNHGGNYAMMHEGIVFSNAAMSYLPVPTVIDLYRAPSIQENNADDSLPNVPKDISIHRTFS